MNIPASWKDVYTDEIRSFTTYKSQSQVFAGINLSFIKKGDRVLLVDDVCAYGETGVRIVEGLKERGVKVVGFAVMFDKVFQGGLEKVAKLGVEAFSCVRIKRLKKDGTVELQ
jgi:adenine/guanine phosphoribosyltransferase-like PRPP-binding protein